MKGHNLSIILSKYQSMPIAFTQFRPFAKNNQKTCPTWTAKKYALSLDSEHYFFTNSECSQKTQTMDRIYFTRIRSISSGSIWIICNHQAANFLPTSWLAHLTEFLKNIWFYLKSWIYEDSIWTYYHVFELMQKGF